MGDFAIRLYIEKKGLRVKKKGVGNFTIRLYIEKKGLRVKKKSVERFHHIPLHINKRPTGWKKRRREISPQVFTYYNKN